MQDYDAIVVGVRRHGECLPGVKIGKLRHRLQPVTPGAHGDVDD